MDPERSRSAWASTVIWQTACPRRWSLASSPCDPDTTPSDTGLMIVRRRTCRSSVRDSVEFHAEGCNGAVSDQGAPAGRRDQVIRRLASVVRRAVVRFSDLLRESSWTAGQVTLLPAPAAGHGCRGADCALRG